jgi:4-hydroxyproline epimerase
MRVIDSHTAGEPTRIVIEGGPDLGTGSMAERRDRFAREFDHIRSFIVNEPRGHDAVVGALLLPPVDPAAVAGVIYFNNVGVIGMCGHGTIGLAVTLAHLARISPGLHRIETPVGDVTFELLSRNEARITNVPAYRHRKGVSVDVPGLGVVTGDVAWGGNWFFLTENASCPVDARNIVQLTRDAQAIMDAVNAAGLGGADGAPVDHVEIFGHPAPGADSRSFVLCPGGAYDRSPCGTGTSAKLACLAADGKLAPETRWIQESVIGSRFEASYTPGIGGRIIPHITGSAFITADATLIADAADPLRWGIGGVAPTA